MKNKSYKISSNLKKMGIKQFKIKNQKLFLGEIP